MMKSKLVWNSLILIVVAFIIALSTLLAADKQSRTRDDVSALLALHAREREAHLKGDATMMVDLLQTPFIEVGEGDIHHKSRADLLKQIGQYFAESQILEWDDVTPPEVHVAHDGSMGWMAVKIRCRYLAKGPKGQPVKTEFVSAWIANYEKDTEGQWRAAGVSSSFQQ